MERWRRSAALPAASALRSRGGRGERAIAEQQVFGRQAHRYGGSTRTTQSP
jgi:hypothetical protein